LSSISEKEREKRIKRDIS